MDGPAAGAGAWDTPIEVTLSRYMDTIAPDPESGREATAARLRAALRAEPIARGCPSLAMITPLDLLGLRAHLELHGTEEIEAVLDALTAFLSWAREQGAHSLSASVVERSLRPPDV